MTDTAPEPRPGVKPERLNAYRTAKEEAPRGSLPSDLLALAAFLAAIDEEPDKDEEDEEDGEEIIGAAEFDDDDRADDEASVALAEDEDDEPAGFAPVDGRDEWPGVVAWLESAGVKITPWQRDMLELTFK